MAFNNARDEFLPSVGIHELESNTWTLLMLFNGCPLADFQDAFPDDEGYIRAYDTTTGTIYGIAPDGTFVTNACFGLNQLSRQRFSATRKFFLDTPWTGTSFGVFRHGALVFSRDVTLDNADAVGCNDGSISPNGKFICITVDSIVTGDRNYIHLYKGV